VVETLGAQPVARDGRFPAPEAFPAFYGTRNPSSRHSRCARLQLMLQPFTEQTLVRLAIPPPRPIARETPQHCPQRRIILADNWLAPLRRAGLSDIPGTPAAGKSRDGPGALRPPGASAAGSPISPAHLAHAWFSGT
jgi:hypothetical protein